jgi:hypothetical protein
MRTPTPVRDFEIQDDPGHVTIPQWLDRHRLQSATGVILCALVQSAIELLVQDHLT